MLFDKSVGEREDSGIMSFVVAWFAVCYDRFVVEHLLDVTSSKQQQATSMVPSGVVGVGFVAFWIEGLGR